MIGDWRVRHLPRCTHHVFLSHCAENRARLVQPVYKALEENLYSPWLDQHHYPKGQDPFPALREGIVHCRHVVSFVTEAFLLQGRGWNSSETAYSELLQSSLHHYGLALCHIHFPLFFVPRSHGVLERSAWGSLVQRGRFYGPGQVDSEAVDWATHQITSFIEQEEARGSSLATQIQNDPSFKQLLEDEENLLLRVMCADPPHVPYQAD